MFATRIYLIFSFDDSSKYVIRCAEILERHGFKGTFYLDTDKLLKELGHKLIVDLYSVGHEIGSHTVTHPDLTTLDRDRVLYELKVSKDVLENILGAEIKSLAYPYGKYNRLILELAKLSGYRNARTVEPFNIKHPDDPFRLGVTFYTDPHALRQILKAVRRLKWVKLLTNPLLLKQWDLLIEHYITHLLNSELENHVVVHILTHPTFIAMRNDWQRFENLLSFLETLPAVNLTVSEYVEII